VSPVLSVSPVRNPVAEEHEEVRDAEPPDRGMVCEPCPIETCKQVCCDSSALRAQVNVTRVTEEGDLMIADLCIEGPEKGESRTRGNIRTLIDTGAAVNLITSSAVERLGLATRRLRRPLHLDLVNNTSVPTQEFVEIALTKGTAMLTTHAVVMPTQYREGFNMILGRPTQRQWDMTIDARDTVTVRGKTGERVVLFERDRQSTASHQGDGEDNRGTRRAKAREEQRERQRLAFCERNNVPVFMVQPTSEDEEVSITQPLKSIDFQGKQLKVDGTVSVDDLTADVAYALSQFESAKQPMDNGTREFVRQLLEALPGLATEGIRLAGAKDARKSPAVTEAHIELVKDPVLPRHSAQRLNDHMRNALLKVLEPMIKSGILKRSSSPHVSRALILPKVGRPGEWRLVVDYRQLNSQIARNSFAIPRIDQCLAALSKGKLFSKLDFASWFHQLKISDKSVPLTAFITAVGSFEYKGLPQGLMISPNHAQKVMSDIFAVEDEFGPFDFITFYIDDLAIISKNDDEHRKHVERVLRRLHEYGVQLNLRKCEFFVRSMQFLGHVIDAESDPHRTLVKPNERITRDIAEFPAPQCQRDVQRFLGLVNFFHALIPKCAEMCAPLSDLQSVEWNQSDPVPPWSGKHQRAFEEVKRAMASKPVVALPRDDLPYVLNMDSSAVGLGGCLMQKGEDGMLHPVIYISKKFSKTEANWTAAEKELFGLVYAIRKFGYLFYGSPYPLTFQNDHRPLSHWDQWNITPKLARWIDDLGQIEWKFEYVPGAKNEMADALSRPPGATAEETSRQLGENVRALVATVGLTAHEEPWEENRHVVIHAVRAASLDDRAGEASDEETWKELRIEELGACYALEAAEQDTYEAEDEQTESEEERELRKEQHKAQLRWDEGQLARLAMTHDVAIPSLQWMLDLRKAYRDDPEQLYTKIMENAESTPNFAVTSNGFVMRAGEQPDDPRTLYIPRSATHIWSKLVHSAHRCRFQGSHMSEKVMYAKLRRYYWWSGMHKDIANVVRTCDACQRTKPITRMTRLPTAHPTPNHCFEVVAIDEKVGLPKTKQGNTSVWVFVDFLSRRVILEPTTGSITSDELASLMHRRLVSQWGAPRKLVSDRGSQFTGEAYLALTKTLGAQRALASSGNPKTAAIAERAIRSMLEPLRAYLSDITNDPDRVMDWDDYIPAIEFAYNDSVHPKIAPYTPFIVSTGREPRVPMEVWLNSELPAGLDERLEWEGTRNGEMPLRHFALPGKDPVTYAHGQPIEEYVRRCWRITAKAREHFQDHTEKALREQRKKFAYAPTFGVGDWVLYSLLTVKDTGVGVRGLLTRKVGPFRVVGIGKNNTYQVDASSCERSEDRKLMEQKAGKDFTRSDKQLHTINGELLTKYYGEQEMDFELDVLDNEPDWNNQRRDVSNTLVSHVALHKANRKARKGKFRLLELFSGNASAREGMHKIFKKGDCEHTGIDCDESMHPDVLMNIRNWETELPKLLRERPDLRKRFVKGYFDVAWVSPGCNPRSSANTVGERDLEGNRQDCEAAARFLESLGIPVVFWENPESSVYRLRDEPFMKDIEIRLGLRPHSTTYCSYGFGYPKPTTIWSNIDIELLHCNTTPCAAKKRLGHHLFTAQAGPSNGKPGTPRNESYKVPSLLMQYLLYRAWMHLLELNVRARDAS